MKRLFKWFTLGLCSFALISCGGMTSDDDSKENDSTNPPVTQTSNILVSYFSCTGTTEKVANLIADNTEGDLFKIEPEIPYTEEDLDYYSGGRADQEQADPTCRPGISNKVEDIDKYDYVFLGYPIWHGDAPRIISIFLESYDLTDKFVIPFCTSTSDGIENSLESIRSSAKGVAVLDGLVIRGGDVDSNQSDTVISWLESLGFYE